MARGKTIVAIDAGTTKICTLIAEIGKEENIHIIGVGVCPSRGLRKGVVVNIEEAVESIGTSIEKAERVSGYKVVSGYVGIGGSHVAALNNRGVIAISHSDRAITHEDIDRAVESARVINVPSNREIIHSIPRQFIVDGQEGIKNPVGMVGFRLDVEAHIVTGATTGIQNLVKCVHRLGVEVDDVVLEPLASSEAVLTEEEKEMGVVLADIGGGTTGVAVFVEGAIAHSSILPVGGNHITNDIAVGLRTPFAMAEEIKIKRGHALSSLIDPSEVIEITTFGRNQREKISRAQLCQIVEARLQETFALLQSEIKKSGYDTLLPAGVVLTGGTSEMAGIADLASEILQVPVRIGYPYGIQGLVDSIGGPSYSTGIGLLLWGAMFGEHSPTRAFGGKVAAKKSNGTGPDSSGMYGRVREWLKTFLP
ncbi:MAG: cell division protein FtsA [Chloroflexi bacterium]|nr:cell division protein FtsA [Chloroflexota bacterium]MDA8188979.1 cell division protein FtsA [Dehalococcoidales bacterium]